jgi:hypothetical protein
MTAKSENKGHPRLYAVRLTTLLYVIAEDDEEAATVAEENEREEAPRIESIVECKTLRDIEREWHFALPYVAREEDGEMSDYTVKDWISKIVKWRKDANTKKG